MKRIMLVVAAVVAVSAFPANVLATERRYSREKAPMIGTSEGESGATPLGNNVIVFARDLLDSQVTGLGWEIFSARSDGTRQRRLTNNVFRDGGPSLSPDRTRILFVRDGKDIYVMDVDGSNEEFIIRGRSSNASPSWSPDGRSIVFVDRQGEISTLDLTDPEAYPVTVGHRPAWSDGDYDWYASDPNWSPGGGRIAFSVHADDEGWVEIVNVVGLNRRRLELGYDMQGLDWSPSGRRIALAMFDANLPQRDRTVPGWEIYTFAPDAAKPKASLRRLTKHAWGKGTHRRINYDPVWSPNGEKLLFSQQPDGRDFELAKINADFRRPRNLELITNNTLDDVAPDW